MRHRAPSVFDYNLKRTLFTAGFSSYSRRTKMASVVPPLLKSLRFNSFRTTRLLALLSSSAKHENGERRTITWNRMCNCYFSSAVEPSEFEDVEFHDDIKATEKQNALHLAVSQLASDFDGEDMLFLHRFFGARRKPVISTGSLKLDLALGIGGLPKGRIVELYGCEASGKTTLALHIIKEAQKLGGHCAYLDVENALDPSLVESIGVNTDDLLISQPDSAENILSIVNTLAKSGSVDVIVVDSVAALVPQREIDTVIGDEYADMQSQIMTKALRKIHHSLCRSETLIIFVNQVRANLRSGQGYRQASEVTCGGNALPFYSAIRMRISRKGLLKTGDKVTGLGIRIEVVKNKLAPAMKKAELEIEFGRGLCSASEVLKLGCEHGVVLQDGGSYFIDGEVLNSEEAAKEYLIQNGTVLDKLVDTLRRQLFENDS